MILFVTNHGEEPACNPDDQAHVDAASALENSRRRHKDTASDDAPNDHLDNDDHDDDDDGDSVADDDGGDNYSASIEKSHFCFETDSLPLPRLNFKLLISVTEKGVIYKHIYVQGVIFNFFICSMNEMVNPSGQPDRFFTVFIGPRCPWSDLWVRFSLTNKLSEPLLQT